MFTKAFNRNAILIGLTGSLILVSGVVFANLRRGIPTGQLVKFEHAQRLRQYRIFVPKGYSKGAKIPLVFFFHGGGGNDRQASGLGFSDIATRERFIAVYPNAVNRHWNDGRDSEVFAKQDREIDDVGFVMAVLGRIKSEFTVDEDRIFATGISNGGFMTQRLAMEKSEVFSAVGIFIASMAKPISNKFAPMHPVSVLYMNGTQDPLVPFQGGEVGTPLAPKSAKRSGSPPRSRGYCISTDRAVSLWVAKNRVKSKPKVSRLPDLQPKDGCTVEKSIWSGGIRGTCVGLYKITGGGHTIPGRPSRFLAKITGNTNQDIDGFEVVWDFFKNHARQPSAKQSTILAPGK